MNIETLPAINATLNFSSTLCLLTAFWAIKKNNKDEVLHKMCIGTSLFLSALFLCSYLTYHYSKGHQTFPDLGWIKTVYLIILVPHVILAVVMLPLIFITLNYGLKANWTKHRKWARWTLPIWLYVSVTGVIIYFMVYQWFALKGPLVAG